MAAATGEAEEEPADLRRRNQELQEQVDALRRDQPNQVIEAGPAADPTPRWERTVKELLADTSWWGRQLPRLYEVLGRADTGTLHVDSDGETPADDRGYTDLMGSLFPPVGSVTWTSPHYPQAVAEGADTSPNGHRAPIRVQV